MPDQSQALNELQVFKAFYSYILFSISIISLRKPYQLQNGTSHPLSINVHKLH